MPIPTTNPFPFLAGEVPVSANDCPVRPPESACSTATGPGPRRSAAGGLFLCFYPAESACRTEADARGGAEQRRGGMLLLTTSCMPRRQLLTCKQPRVREKGEDAIRGWALAGTPPPSSCHVLRGRGPAQQCMQFRGRPAG